ncbi:hypothetical protein VTN77DRAFT_5807 [Rasamsonia byssochlamydoides]|uniref:uncharacterized protein n=1 Tax=Rasamsonia byssochlamydoides TaxID=89139 RepID=UPI00374378FD
MGCCNSRQEEETPVSNVEVKMLDVAQRAQEHAGSAPSLRNGPEYIVNVPIRDSERTEQTRTGTISVEHRNRDNTATAQGHMDGTTENPVANLGDGDNSIVASLPTPPAPDVRCSYCCEAIVQRKDRVLPLPLRPCKKCSLPVCNSCVRRMFVNACKNEASMPPRCCAPIPVTYARFVLSSEEVAHFKEKYEEWSTPNRVYCPIPTCSAFIPYRLFPTSAGGYAQSNPNHTVAFVPGIQTPPPTPPHSTPEVAAPSIPCPKCEVLICCSCKQLAHPGTPCSDTPDIDPDMADLLRRWGIKRCPKCRAAVRRMYGCSHMQCRCGAQWCWWCTGPIRVCRARPCPAEREAAAFEDEIHGAADEWHEEDDQRRVVDAETETEISIVLQQGDDEGEQQPGAPVPAPERHLINLDAGRHWEDAEEDFGSEPNIDEMDPFDCDHTWDAVEVEEMDEEIDYECARCWRTLVPRPKGYTYLGMKELLETGSFTQKPKTAALGGGSDAFINLCHRCGMTLCEDCRELDRRQRRQ